uniref:Uncharacterized protein n=1 Tax=Ditylenchus dipsaci TaxID=166011 RepID=A0A915DF90_9BILA
MTACERAVVMTEMGASDKTRGRVKLMEIMKTDFGDGVGPFRKMALDAEISSYLTSSAADNSLECHLWMALIHLVIIEMIDMLLMANNTFSQQSETEIYTELSLQQDSSDYQPMTSPSTNRSSVLSSPCSEYNHSLAFSTDSTSTPKTYLKMNGATARRILRRNPTVSLKTDRTDMILIPCYASKFHSHSDGLITQPEKNDDYENIPLKSEENYFPQPKKRLCEYIPESAQASKGWSMVDLTDLGTTSGLVYFQNSSEPSKSKPKHFLIKENKSNHNYLDRNMPFIALETMNPLVISLFLSTIATSKEG